MRILKRHPEGPTFEILGTIGDCNPVDYGGGYVLKVTQPNGHETFEVEWIEPDNEDEEDSPVTIYRCEIPEDCLEEYEWVDVWRVAQATGQSTAALRRQAVSENPQARANFLWDVAGHYGWHELDHGPLPLSRAEALKRWELDS